jgi:hypothetical protein
MSSTSLPRPSKPFKPRAEFLLAFGACACLSLLRSRVEDRLVGGAFVRKASVLDEVQQPPRKVQTQQWVRTEGAHKEFAELVQRNLSRSCEGKERLLEIVMEASITLPRGDEGCDRVPSWSDVVALYGDEPVVYGLETCQQYRETIRELGLDPDPRIAGTFNTGTHLLLDILSRNLPLKEYSTTHEMDVPSGKHTMLADNRWYRDRVKRTKADRSYGPFPIVVVRDPYRWMNSMCKMPYRARWERGLNGHCPNLVPTARERSHPDYENITTTFVVTVNDSDDQRFDSLADVWSSFYGQYMNATIPRLIVRYEDLLHHTREVTQLVGQCLGYPALDTFRYPLAPSKGHGRPSGFVDALIKYSGHAGRYGRMSREDRNYAKAALDPILMRTFRYAHSLQADSISQIE